MDTHYHVMLTMVTCYRWIGPVVFFLSPTVVDLSNANNAGNMTAEQILDLVENNFEDFVIKYARAGKGSSLAVHSMQSASTNTMSNNRRVTNDQELIVLITEIITLFDDKLMEENALLQLLFREYQLQ
eukprot:1043574_1